MPRSTESPITELELNDSHIDCGDGVTNVSSPSSLSMTAARRGGVFTGADTIVDTPVPVPRFEYSRQEATSCRSVYLGVRGRLEGSSEVADE